MIRFGITTFILGTVGTSNQSSIEYMRISSRIIKIIPVTSSRIWTTGGPMMGSLGRIGAKTTNKTSSSSTKHILNLSQSIFPEGIFPSNIRSLTESNQIIKKNQKLSVMFDRNFLPISELYMGAYIKSLLKIFVCLEDLPSCTNFKYPMKCTNFSWIFLRRQILMSKSTSKSWSENLSIRNKHLWTVPRFCFLQDKTWIKMPKWTIFLISSKKFVLIAEIFCRNFWCNFWRQYLSP